MIIGRVAFMPKYTRTQSLMPHKLDWMIRLMGQRGGRCYTYRVGEMMQVDLKWEGELVSS